MAPVGTVGDLSLFSAPLMGIISLVVFLILSITLLALCVKCNRGDGSASEGKGSKTDGAAANGSTDGDIVTNLTWRNYKNMPPSTLARPKAYTN